MLLHDMYGVPAQAEEYCIPVLHAAHVRNRQLQALYDLWEARRAGRPVPARSDFSVFDFRPWLGHLLILDNLQDRTEIRYRLFGTKLIDIFGIDLTWKTALEATILIGDRPLIEYEEVARSQRPIYVSRFSPSVGRHIRVDKLMLPLASCNGFDQIVAAIYPSPRL